MARRPARPCVRPPQIGGLAYSRFYPWQRSVIFIHAVEINHGLAAHLVGPDPLVGDQLISLSPSGRRPPGLSSNGLTSGSRRRRWRKSNALSRPRPRLRSTDGPSPDASALRLRAISSGFQSWLHLARARTFNSCREIADKLGMLQDVSHDMIERPNLSEVA
jgi:hypothetical protein